MAKQKHKNEIICCPVARFFLDLEKVYERKSIFFEHLNSSRIEFLKAVRSLFDERIDSLEKMGAKRSKKMPEIEVG
jgi:hypothetical protein